MSFTRLLFLALSLVGCKDDPASSSKDDSGTDDTESPGSGCIPYAGPSGSSDIHVGAQILVADALGEAQSTLDDMQSPIPYNAPTVLFRNSCGETGIIVRQSKPDGLFYVDLTSGPSTPELVTTDTSVHDDIVVQANILCDPMVVFPDSPNGYAEQVRDKGVWSPPTPISVTSLFDETPKHLSHREAWLDTTGDLNVTALILVDDAWLLHGTRSPEGAWTFETTPAPENVGSFGSIRADEDGGFHVLYSRTEYPCDPCDLNIYHGYRPSGGAWTETVVEDTTWGDPDDRFAMNPALSLSPDGTPIVVATWQHRAITGSLLSQELRVYAPQGDGWCHDVLAAEGEGYVGADGPEFTGANPRVDFDPLGRPHVLFSDTAQWHNDKGWANAVNGQLRHAMLHEGGWTLNTLIEQPGQTESPNPLQGLENPMISFSSDGSGLVAGGVTWSWDTSSVFNDGPAPITWTVTLVEASIETAR